MRQQVIHRREQKRGGFAGPGLGLASEIFAVQGLGQRLCLDRRAVAVAKLRASGLEARLQQKINDTDSGKVVGLPRSEEHPSELQSLMCISYAVSCLKKTKEFSHQIHSRQDLS